MVLVLSFVCVLRLLVTAAIIDALVGRKVGVTLFVINSREAELVNVTSTDEVYVLTVLLCGTDCGGSPNRVITTCDVVVVIDESCAPDTESVSCCGVDEVSLIKDGVIGGVVGGEIIEVN